MATPPKAFSELGVAGWIAQAFVDSKLTPLIILFAIGIGAFALLQLPREEEPQIIVPMVDVFVSNDTTMSKHSSGKGSMLPSVIRNDALSWSRESRH